MNQGLRHVYPAPAVVSPHLSWAPAGGLCQAAADALRLSPGDECDAVSPCRESARHFIQEHFPVQALRGLAEEAVGEGARMPPAKMERVY